MSGSLPAFKEFSHFVGEIVGILGEEHAICVHLWLRRDCYQRWVV